MGKRAVQQEMIAKIPKTTDAMEKPRLGLSAPRLMSLYILLSFKKILFVITLSFFVTKNNVKVRKYP